MNALKPDDRLAPVDFAPLAGATLGSLAGATTVDLRPGLFTAGLLLLVLDTLAGLWLGGFLGRLRALRAGPAALILAALVASSVPVRGVRAEEPPANRSNGIESALITRLAYVITGDAAVDEASRAGLTGLTQMLAARTALEPGEPAGLDPAKDELAFYPLIYWPIAPNRPLPSEAAIRKMADVRALHSVSGAFDMVAEAVTPSIGDMDALIDRIGALEGVERTTSSIILSTKIDR